MSIKIFIGSEPKTSISRDVLKYSILKNTKHSVDFQPLESDDSWAKRPKDGWRQTLGTGFSLLRWDIPERCDYKGSAIYLDADQLVFDDIVKLWEQDVPHPKPGCSVWCTYQAVWGKKDKFKEYPSNQVSPETSVMLIDCAAAKDNQPNLDAIIPFLENDTNRTNYVRIMRCAKHKIQPQRIADSWNRLNKFIPKKTSLLHYTQEPNQPWYKPKHEFSYLWEEALVGAIKEGFVSLERVQEAISQFTPHANGVRGCGLHPYYTKVIK